MPGQTVILEGGNALTESTKIYTDLLANSAGSSDAAAALLSLAGVVFGLVGKIEAPFTQALAAGVGVNAGALGVVISGIQLSAAIDQYKEAMAGYDGAAQQAAYENLADKTCGIVAGIGGTIAAIPGFQPLGLAIWLGASLAQQYTNGNFDRLVDFIKLNVFHVDSNVNGYTTNALNWVAPRRDPLVLDLDGGGITTSGINPSAPILFDQDGDGTKTATGWIASGEAIVVRDLNGNGTIDSGRELFGDNTILTHGPHAGQTAANGFEALADLDADANGVADGKFDSNDVAFSSVKLWKDLNQDGISQANELFSFSDLGLASINVTGTAGNVNLGGGNTQTFSGSFTRADGSNGDSGTAQLAGSLLLANNNFYRQFTDDPVVATVAQALPQMQGSGAVRDLRPAMSLGNAQATALQSAVSAFAQGSTRAQQLVSLDAVIQSWGNTSSMQTSLLTSTTLASPAGPGSVTAVAQFAQDNPTLYAQITALEQFNGQTILDKWVRANGNTNAVSFSAQQQALIEQAYNALRDSVYGALVVQTRLKPYIDSIGLQIAESGIHFDPSAAIALVEGKAAIDPLNAVADLIDLQKYASQTVSTVGWQPYKTLSGILETTAITSDIQGLLAAEHIATLGAIGTNLTATDTAGMAVLGNSLSNVLTGAEGSDQLHGFSGNDTLYAFGNNDTLDGGAGDDVLSWTGSSLIRGTTFVGGTGNDTITGAAYGNTYVFNQGDGQDTITNYTPATNYSDVLQLGAGIAAADSTPVRSGLDLVLKLAGTDQITIKNWFLDGAKAYQIDQVKFADGTVWTNAQINARALEVFGTASNDTMSAVAAFASVLHGGDGNDTLTSQGIGDVLYGDNGNDTLLVTNNFSTLNGGAGDDTLSWTSSSLIQGTTFIGGTGNDTITGAAYGNTYVFNQGDGQDTVTNYTPAANFSDIVQLGSGITAALSTAARSGLDLVLKFGGSDQITIKNWYADGTGAYQIDQVKFADGTVWTNAQINAQTGVIAGTSAADTLTGTSAFADILMGFDGNDTLTGQGANDRLYGGNGNDVLLFNDNFNTLDGGAGDDVLSWTGSPLIQGTTFIGGAGNDTITGAAYGNTYVFNQGDGQDTITNYTPATSFTDVLKLGVGISAADSSPVRSGLDLVLKFSGSDQITVKNWFSDGAKAYQIDQIRFDDGTVWTNAQVSVRALDMSGTAGNDVLTGVAAFADVLRGQDGNDTLIGQGANDVLYGGNGNDTLLFNDNFNTLDGGAGDDVLSWTGSPLIQGTTFIGGAGNDTITGAAYNNTYIFNQGDGQDVVTNYTTAGGFTDVAVFGQGIASNQLWFTHSGNDLEVSVIGTGDKFTVSNWYLGTQYHVEQFKTSDGKVLLDSQVQNLVDAMAAFAPPAAGQTTLPANYATTLNPALAANWQ